MNTYQRNYPTNRLLSEAERKERYELVLESTKECGNCHVYPPEGKKLHVLFYKDTGTKAMGCPWNNRRLDLTRLVGLCKTCRNSDAYVFDIGKNVGSNKHENQLRPAQSVDSSPHLSTYIGPAPKWLKLKLEEVCKEASIRFDHPVSVDDFESLLPEEEEEKVEPITMETLPGKIDALTAKISSQVERERRFRDGWECRPNVSKLECTCPEHEEFKREHA